MPISATHHRALALLAANPRGMPEGLLAAHGISIETMVALVGAGHATAHSERARASDREIEVAIVKIRDAGREVLGANALPQNLAKATDEKI
jgi:hypothetical protein